MQGKTLISLPMIRTYMVICLLHMYQQGYNHFQLLFLFYFFFLHQNFILQTSEFYVDICGLDLFPYLKGFKEVLQLEYNI